MASPSSMPSSPLAKDEEPRNWSELPQDLISSIMLRLGVAEILKTAQKVCTSWRRVSKEPSLWRIIDMRYQERRDLDYNALDKMCRQAVDRSEGGLVKINIGYIESDSLLTYIADRSSNLRSLGIEMNDVVTNQGLVNVLAKLPLLEELKVRVPFIHLDLKAIGHSCPKLKTLKLDCCLPQCSDGDYCLAIAESMPQLHHLTLIGDNLTDTMLNAILDNCPNLEHLDLSKCYIIISEDLEKRCLEMVKDFRRPNNSVVADVAFCFNSMDNLIQDLGEPDYSSDSYYDSDYLYD